MGTKGVIMMSLGSNLKTIRLFRNKTLKELGQILGFSTSSADVRISQYESDKKKPRENVIENLAYKLDVSPQAIDIPDIETYIGAIYTLSLIHISEISVMVIFGDKATSCMTIISLVSLSLIHICDMTISFCPSPKQIVSSCFMLNLSCNR